MGGLPKEWLKLKHSRIQGNHQICDVKPAFWNSFTKQTQHFLCTSNALFKWPETIKAKKEQRNWRNNHHAPLMNERLTTTQKQKKNYKKYNTHTLSFLQNPNINAFIFVLFFHLCFCPLFSHVFCPFFKWLDHDSCCVCFFVFYLLSVSGPFN